MHPDAAVPSIPGPPQSLGVELKSGSCLLSRFATLNKWLNLLVGPFGGAKNEVAEYLLFDLRTVNTSILGRRVSMSLAAAPPWRVYRWEEREKCSLE